jgi:hypothetical protein
MTGAEESKSPVASAEPTPCRHLRSAGMYIYSDGSPEAANDGYDSSSYWCSTTMKCFGPDDGMVGGRECRDPSRSCHQPI